MCNVYSVYLSLVKQEMFMFMRAVIVTTTTSLYNRGIFPRLYKKSHSRVFCKNSSNPHQNAGLKNITHREIFEFVFVKNIDMLQAYKPLNKFP